MKSIFLELIPDFQNNMETLNVISAWPFSASVELGVTNAFVMTWNEWIYVTA